MENKNSKEMTQEGPQKLRNLVERQVKPFSPLDKRSVAIIVAMPILLVFVFVGILYLSVKLDKITQSKPITDSARPSLIKRPSPTPDISSNWQTYRNEEFGFEVRYPRDSSFEANIFGSELRLLYKKGGESLGRFSITTRATDKKDISEVPLPMNSGYTKVGLYDAIQSVADSPPFSWNSYLLIGNGKEYNLYIEWYQTKGKEDFDQILSRFGFVE